MSDLFTGEGSIEDILRNAANEVINSTVPEGFVYIPEYGQYYSSEYNFYYDPNTYLYYSSENMTYYTFNEETYEYDVVQCCQPTKWSSNNNRKRAMHVLGEAEFIKFDQDLVDACETIFSIIAKITKNEEPVAQKKVEVMIKKPKDKITAADIRRMLRKRKNEYNVVFDEASGEFREVKKSSSPADNDDYPEDDEDDQEFIGGDERAILMQQEGYNEAPLLRIIDKNRKLYIITMSGGYIGSDSDCEVIVENKLLPERCAEFDYSEEVGCYTITKLVEGCVVQCNSTAIKVDQPFDICHGDVILISGERFSIHVHFGSNTCPSCEPGLFVPNVNEDELHMNPKYISGEIARRKNLKKIMRSCGITPDEALSKPIRKGDRKPITGPSLENIDRSNDPYSKCAAKPLAESERKFALPGPSAQPQKEVQKPKPIDSGNIGFKLLKTMGWTEGKGLGKDKQGKVEPVSTEVKNNRHGLGTANEPAKKPKSYKDLIREKTMQRYKEAK